MKKIGLVTVGRSDYGIYTPLLRKLVASEFELKLYVSGMHLAKEFGETVRFVENDGYAIHERIPSIHTGDSPGTVTEAISDGVRGFGRSFEKFSPDLLIVLGDRFEMFAATVAALPFQIPVMHIHGGELTEGAMDDSLRHSMTKLSHIHCVSTEAYKRRVIQLGESPDRVYVTGALALDHLKDLKLLSIRELELKFKMTLPSAPLLVTFHPTTSEYQDAGQQISQLLAALDHFSEMPIVFTLPNADPSGRLIAEKIRSYCSVRLNTHIVENFGTEGYFSMMSHAMAMVGNSSSGIIEAASFHLPVLNIGTRQRGRIRAENVIDVGYGEEEICQALRVAVSPQFKAKVSGISNPYGDGGAAGRILEILRKELFARDLAKKSFYDLNF